MFDEFQMRKTKNQKEINLPCVELDCNRNHYVLRDNRMKNHFHGRCIDVLPGMDYLHRNRSVNGKTNTYSNSNDKNNKNTFSLEQSTAVRFEKKAPKTCTFQILLLKTKARVPTPNSRFNFISIKNTDGVTESIFFCCPMPVRLQMHVTSFVIRTISN